MNSRFFKPRFGLKILFGLIAMVAVFCAYHVNWIHQRHAFLARQLERLSDARKAMRRGPIYIYATNFHWERKRPKSTTNLLWLFGEKNYENVEFRFMLPLFDANSGRNYLDQYIDSNRDFKGEEIALAESLFPEAEIDPQLYYIEPREVYDARP